ncbi:MAG: methyl-accepting chemotaxis protein, partial [Burkholderiaceae bacterium]
MKLSDIKIGTRLSVLAGFLLVITIAVGAEGWSRLSESNINTTEALQRASILESSVDTARTAQVNFKIQVQEWKDLLLRGGDPAAFDKYQKAFSKKSEETQGTLQKLKGTLVKLGLDTALVDEALSQHQGLGVKYLEALKQYDSTNAKSAQIVDALVKGMDRAPTKKFDEIVNYVLEQSDRMMKQSITEAEANYKSARQLLLIAVILAIAIGGAATWWLIKSITKPLNLAVKLAQTVASGDLTSHINATSKDETGQLLAALKNMNQSLVKIVGDVRVGTETMATASSQIAVGNLDLSSRTEQQAASLEETASSMEELTATVRQNA